jgi:hypothetical protein
VDVTIYPVIITPLTGVGAVHETFALLPLYETPTEVGAFGTAAPATLATRVVNPKARTTPERITTPALEVFLRSEP